jgi:hypothetical protein
LAADHAAGSSDMDTFDVEVSSNGDATIDEVFTFDAFEASVMYYD